MCWKALVLAAALAWAPSAAHAQPVTPPPIAAKAFILVDTLSGRTLAAGAESDRFEPASLTKVMTAYVVFSAMRAGELGSVHSWGSRRGDSEDGGRWAHSLFACVRA